MLPSLFNASANRGGHMICPKCQGTMSKEMFGVVEVDRCDECQGVWFDAGELERQRKVKTLAESTIDIRFTATTGTQPFVCPSCRRTTLVIGQAMGFEVEQCTECRGIFLDDKEVTRVNKRWRQELKARVGQVNRRKAKREARQEMMKDVMPVIIFTQML